jgi:tRNA (guanine6-N2)-methyltransferase
MSAMEHIFAITTRGLEAVSADEMAGLAGVEVTQCAYRRIEADYTGSLDALLSLRTVDDVFLRLAVWEQVAPQRSALAQIRGWIRELDLSHAVGCMTSLRPIQAAPSFSVTVNFVGKRNYSAEEVKEAVSAEVAARLGWRYGAENETELNLRVFIEHERGYVGARLSDHPLHSRLYKQAHLSGSLKPSVAAGMLHLAAGWPEALLLDPFCGAGTIPIEAGLSGLRAAAGDRDPKALAAAGENARIAGVPVQLTMLDAQRLPFERRSIDFVVSNLPWGRQVQVDEPLKDLYRTVCAEVERVLRVNGAAVLLTNLPELVVFQRLAITRQVEISLFGQTPTILLIAGG